MSNIHNYHHADVMDSLGEESDSDTDIDLRELDPVTTHADDTFSPKTHRARKPFGRVIPLRNLRLERSRGLRNDHRIVRGNEENIENVEDLRGLLGEDAAPRESQGSVEDNAPLLKDNSDPASKEFQAEKNKTSLSSRWRLLTGLLSRSALVAGFGDSPKAQSFGASRNISIGQYPPPRFPPNAVSNAKYTAWSFLPRTLYNEFSFFFNMYFLLVALSQIIPPLRIGYLSTYVAPLAFVLAITLGKEALDDVARRRRDNEANKEGYTVLRLRTASQTSAKAFKGRSKRDRHAAVSKPTTRLEAIAEEEDSIGDMDHETQVEMDEIMIKSRDLKVGDILRLGKDQRVPADLVILKSYTTESAVAVTSQAQHSFSKSDGKPNNLLDDDLEDPTMGDLRAGTKADLSKNNHSSSSADTACIGETFIRTDQLDGETDWKLRLASPLTQSLDPRSFTRLKIVAGKPDRKVNEFVGTVEYSSPTSKVRVGQESPSTQRSVKSAPLTIDNTAWANTVLASSATVLAVVVYTGAQTRQALSTSPSRSKTGLLESEINNLTKILCALTLTLSIVLVALEGFEKREDQKWYVAITRFLILFSTIIPISLRVNLDMGKTVYAWFVERDQDIPDTVVRTSTIPEELGRIEYLLSDKTGTLTQNGNFSDLHDL